MTSSHKLTGVLKGRTISGTSNQGDMLTIRFEDGSLTRQKFPGHPLDRQARVC